MRKLVLVAVTALSACAAAAGYDPSTMTDRDQAWLNRAMKNTLKDPATAQIENVRVFQADNGARMICGEVNSRNSFGGYSGFQMFEVLVYPTDAVRPHAVLGMVAEIDCGGAGYTKV